VEASSTPESDWEPVPSLSAVHPKDQTVETPRIVKNMTALRIIHLENPR
jgi:hypothetical protein